MRWILITLTLLAALAPAAFAADKPLEHTAYVAPIAYQQLGQRQGWPEDGAVDFGVPANTIEVRLHPDETETVYYSIHYVTGAGGAGAWHRKFPAEVNLQAGTSRGDSTYVLLPNEVHLLPNAGNARLLYFDRPDTTVRLLVNWSED